MASEALKSTAITNLDSTPPIPNTPSTGGPSMLRTADGNVTATTGATSPSTYQVVRIPRNAIIKHLWVKLNATVTTFTANVGLYYSDSTSDGTPAAKQGTALAATCFASAVAFAAQNTFVDLISSGAVAAANLDLPAWQGLGGLSSDPGGYLDIVFTTTATNSGAPVVYAECQYTE